MFRDVIPHRVVIGMVDNDAFKKVVVCAEILPRDFLHTLGNYYLSLTIAKIQSLKKFRQFLKALTVKLSIFTNRRTSHPETLIKVYKQLAV